MTYSDYSDNQDRADRLAACALVRTRFAGRKYLELCAASEVHDVSLTRLEYRLGLATEAEVTAAKRRRAISILEDMVRSCKGGCEPGSEHGRALGYLLAGPEARERQAAMDYARYPSLARVARMAAYDECTEIDNKRRARAEHKRQPDLQPERILRQWVDRYARSFYDSCSFRRAAHDHELRVVYVEPGDEGAGSESGRDWAVAKAHRSYRYPNATSSHTLYVSRCILQPEVRILNDAAPRRILYLAVDVRVRQGRGTTLLAEVRSGDRGGWRLR